LIHGPDLLRQEHIYGEKVVNPLEDDSAAFSNLFSGRAPFLEHAAADRPHHIKQTNAFPKDRHTGEPDETHGRIFLV
jgi:hypothetical protein